MLEADCLKTSDYAEDGSGNPTTGFLARAGATSATPPLKVAPAGLQIGTKTFSESWIARSEHGVGWVAWNGASFNYAGQVASVATQSLTDPAAVVGVRVTLPAGAFPSGVNLGVVTSGKYTSALTPRGYRMCLVALGYLSGTDQHYLDFAMDSGAAWVSANLVGTLWRFDLHVFVANTWA